MRFIKRGDGTAAVLDRADRITQVRDILDVIASAFQCEGCAGLILYKESLSEAFFDLKTGFAGEVLQKFSNYRMKLAIVGDFSGYTSKSLRDFIYECNHGGQIRFADSVEKALDFLLPGSGEIS